MRRDMPIRLLSLAACLAVGVWAIHPGDAHAQRAAEGSEEPRQETRRVQAMREVVLNPLQEAQACAENDDMQCARRLLDRVRERSDLNPFERANMWSFYGYVYASQENWREAITAYENVLREEDLPLGLETSATQTLTQLYFQEERYQEALDMLNRWLALLDNPTPDPYIMKAQIHYQLRQYREGIEPVLRALEIARERGRQPQESWYQLLNVFYYELEDYPAAIRNLHILVENWPKKEYLVTLAALYGQEGDETRQLALFEAAHEMGWLTRGSEMVQLASMFMQSGIPYKAATIMDAGLREGTIDSTEANWRLASQAWTLAQEYEKALPALNRAASMSRDGNLDLTLAQSYQNLARWEECAGAARTALRKGDLRRPDQANLMLGVCLFELKEYGEARQAFQAAARDERTRRSAQQWLDYVQSEQSRERQLAEAIAAR